MPPEQLQQAIGGHPLVAQTLWRRGVKTKEQARAFLDAQAYQPSSPFDLPDMEKTVARLERAIREGEQICVWGDFDVDGQTATSLLVSLLQGLGARVSYHIPVRARESHGVNLPVLRQVLEAGAQVVLTCDTGVSAHEAALFARQAGVDFLVTDHHDLPDELPQAYTLVNPKRMQASHPLATLPGVGVAYKLAEALLQRAGREEACAQFLDLVALGIVADVATLQGDTRYLLQRGLKTLRQTERRGLQAMMEFAEVNPRLLNEEQIGFMLGPRMNALGRLADANLAVELLTMDNLSRARTLALQLESLNEQRKLLTSQVFQGALAQIEAEPGLLRTPALVLAHAGWPAGVLGIVASRLVERYGKPVILLTTPPAQAGRGSARSVEGVNITAAIAEQQDMLAGFGGHPMAAGLSLPPSQDVQEQVERFRRRLAGSILAMTGGVTPEKQIDIDATIPLGQISMDFVEDMERLAPFGAGNPPLCLCAPSLKLGNSSALGKNEEHLLLIVEDQDGESHRVVWWQGAGWSKPEGYFDLAYHVRASSYRGERQVQVELVDFRPAQDETGALIIEPSLEVIDLRHAPRAEQRLSELRSTLEGIQVWCEGGLREEVAGLDRNQLAPGRYLVVWTAPPGPRELATAVQAVAPQVVYLFAHDPGLDQAQAFLERLAGLVKRALSQEPVVVEVSRLAAATAQRPATVMAGLNWMAARGIVRMVRQEGERVWLEAGDGVTGEELAAAAAGLKEQLEESAAYRAYYGRADVGALRSGM